MAKKKQADQAIAKPGPKEKLENLRINEVPLEGSNALAAPLGITPPGGNTITAQADTLAQGRLNGAQRVAVAGRIGQHQGNQHLQRVVDRVSSQGNGNSSTSSNGKGSKKVNRPTAKKTTQGKTDLQTSEETAGEEEFAVGGSPALASGDPPENRGVLYLPMNGQSQVQRSPGLPGGALAKIPYTYTIKKNTSIGKYIKITEVGVNIGGSVEEMAKPGESAPTAGGGTSTSRKDPKKDAATFAIESKKEADNFFADKLKGIDDSIKPYEKKGAKFSRSDDEATANVSYETGVDVEPFVFDNTTFSSGIEFNLIELKKEGGKKPELKGPNATGKVELGGKAENFPIDGMKVELKGEFFVVFEPDWATLAIFALETPVGWALAAAAGAAAIIYFSLKDIERKQQMGMRVKAVSRMIIRSADKYGQIVAGKSPSGKSKYDTQAVSRGQADLAKILAQKKITQETYLALVEADNLEAEYWKKGYYKYMDAALLDFNVEVAKEIEAWHDEHWVQSFFSGSSAMDDIAVVDAIISQQRKREGRDVIG